MFNDKKIDLSKLNLDIIQLEEVKEYTIECFTGNYTIRLDFNSLLKITEGLGQNWEVLYVNCLIDNKGLYNNMLKALTYCSDNTLPEDFFIDEMILNAKNIETLEEIFKELANEVYDVDTLQYIDQKIVYKYIKLEEIKEVE